MANKKRRSNNKKTKDSPLRGWIIRGVTAGATQEAIRAIKAFVQDLIDNS